MNFKTNSFAVLFFAITLLSSCSSDDSAENNSNPNENQNQITFNGESYELKSAFINDENTTDNNPSDIGINLSNKTISETNSGNDLSNITTIYFDFTDTELQETTYTDITDYEISVGGTLTSGSFTPGTILLSDNDSNSNIYASNSAVTINDLTTTTVDLTFSFTRNDGQTISGSYNGTYAIPDTTD